VATVPRPEPANLRLKTQRALAGQDGYVPLTRDEETLLARRSREGDREATWALVMANQNFVRLIAQRYLRDDVDAEDLVAEGLLGLVDAAERFDPDRGIKFITYGVWWVKRAILRHLRTVGHPVHVPKYKEHEMLAFRRAHARLTQELGRKPTVREACEATGADESSLREFFGLAAPSESIDTTSPDAEVFLDDADGPEESAIRQDALERVSGLMHVLPRREREVLDARFELGEATRKTLATIGVELGLTKERVRQIELSARRKLREAMDDPSVVVRRPASHRGRSRSRRRTALARCA
jgi:RNA polymerase primary sigma factor